MNTLIAIIVGVFLLLLKRKVKAMKKARDRIEATPDSKLVKHILDDEELKAVSGTGITEIIVSDDAVLARTGMTGIGAMCVLNPWFGTKHIFVNTAFMKSSKSVRCAILAHEAGHINLGHLEKMNSGNIGGFKGMKAIEVEADNYANDRGYDIKGAMLALVISNPSVVLSIPFDHKRFVNLYKM